MELDCGIRNARIVRWLDDELSLERCENTWTFPYENQVCSIMLAPLDDRLLGSLAFERTHVSISGDPTAVDELYRLFTLRFMSAGG